MFAQVCIESARSMESRQVGFDPLAIIGFSTSGQTRVHIVTDEACMLSVFAVIDDARVPFCSGMLIQPQTSFTYVFDPAPGSVAELELKPAPKPAPAPDPNPHRDLIDALGGQLQNVSDYYKREFRDLPEAERDWVLRAAAEEMVESIEPEEYDDGWSGDDT